MFSFGFTFLDDRCGMAVGPARRYAQQEALDLLGRVME